MTTTTPTKRARPAAKAASVKSTVTDETEAAPAPPGTIKFRGRTMPVGQLEAGQLGMWAVIMKRLRQSTKTELDDEAKAKLLAQTIEMISSVLSDVDDVDWVEAEMLAGRIKLEDAVDGIMGQAATAFQKGAKKTAASTRPRPQARRAR